jgi:D-alanyl-D-alanine carboxypeptidase
MKKQVLVVIICMVPALVMRVAAQDIITEADLADLLAFYMEDESNPGGAISVYDNGEVVSVAYGTANLETGVAITVEDRFRIGSITKTMVAAAVLSLVETGEIELDEPIANYLDDEIVQSLENADTASIRQVLQMTSGIYSYTESDAFDDATLDNPSYPWASAEVVIYAYDEPAYFAPGEAYYYSNTNYNLAELLINEVTGMTLAEALEAIIFEPVGMANCYVEATPERFADGIVRGYEGGEDDSEFVDITEINDGVGLGDGGVICAAEDLALFLPALYEGEIIGQAMLDEMFDAVDDGDGQSYGLGIDYNEGEWGLLIGHGGSTSGFNGYIGYLPEEGIGVTILTNNFDADYVEDVVDEAFFLAFGG